MAPCGILDLSFGIFPSVDVQGCGMPLRRVTACLQMAARVAPKAEASDLRFAPVLKPVKVLAGKKELVQRMILLEKGRGSVRQPQVLRSVHAGGDQPCGGTNQDGDACLGNQG